MKEAKKEAKTSILGIVCLILAIVLIALVNLSILIVLGFLYYAYKILYKKEELSNRDKILIVILFLLFLLEIILSIYLAVSYVDIYEPYEYIIPE